MTESILDPQDNSGADSSQEADVSAGFNEQGDDAVTNGDGAAEGATADSHEADVDAGYSDGPE